MIKKTTQQLDFGATAKTTKNLFATTSLRWKTLFSFRKKTHVRTSARLLYIKTIMMIAFIYSSLTKQANQIKLSLLSSTQKQHAAMKQRIMPIQILTSYHCLRKRMSQNRLHQRRTSFFIVCLALKVVNSHVNMLYLYCTITRFFVCKPYQQLVQVSNRQRSKRMKQKSKNQSRSLFFSTWTMLKKFTRSSMIE